MDYLKVFVATTNKGHMQVVTNEMRDLMRNGIQRKLVPYEKGAKKLVLDKSSEIQIAKLKNSIKMFNRKISSLEARKVEPDLTPHQFAVLEREIERIQFKIFEAQNEIHEIKKMCFKGKDSIIDLSM